MNRKRKLLCIFYASTQDTSNGNSFTLDLVNNIDMANFRKKLLFLKSFPVQ